ncbi:RAQPRD family integrative conjugative element protein [Oceanicoccus sp. KOV_DT_Chl]|uniref:integrative conjugative element protein, RAQPRD family n=1 Tax=Oceanicoccus sp. KOV_DT_Chl TaxID=1904639 RepID=UPI000C7B08B9|nr:RAQPRD family integrative conjugative element protein [Oceanicoccus sp. KOV_DT_Chl]
MRTPVISSLILALLSAPTYAITDQERSVLQRLNTELGTVTKIIDEAQQAANQRDRRQIDYQRLSDDLQKIQQGILDAINSERREPRSLPPVDGNYR